MKTYVLSASAIGIVILLVASSFSSKPQVIDLHKLVKHKGIQVYNRQLTLLKEDAHRGIRLSKDYGEGVAWIKDIEFSNGTIEFDVRGENIKQHSFVGIAFHGQNDSTFDAIYLRPFQFKEQDQVLRSRSIQYVALPEFTWRKLREKSPGKYEHSIEPSPDPDSWVKVRVVVKGAMVSTYINGSQDPSLVIEKVSPISRGTVGFYVADTSGGDFANLTITKAD